MKLRATKKDFKGERVLQVGYCKVQFLFPERDAFAYSAGVYGWACDYYKANGFYVSTGYNPIGFSTPKSHEICERYDALAREIKSSNYNERMERLSKLQDEFVREIRIVMNWY